MSEDNDLNMAKAQQFRDLLIKPILDNMNERMDLHIATMEATLKGMVSNVNLHGDRINKLEGAQKKALMGWGVISAALATFVGAAWGMIKSHFHWS